MKRERPDAQQKLAVYEELLIAWAPRLDLISPGDLSRIGTRHIEDSLRVLPLLDRLPDLPCIDVGSGAGLPGVPLAIVSGRRWRLLEPRHKRAAFLEEVLRELALDTCEVVIRSAEDAARDPRFQGAHAVATARALASTGRAARLCHPLVAAGGTTAIYVGPLAEIPPGAEEVEPGLITIAKDAT